MKNSATGLIKWTWITVAATVILIGTSLFQEFHHLIPGMVTISSLFSVIWVGVFLNAVAK